MNARDNFLPSNTERSAVELVKWANPNGQQISVPRDWVLLSVGDMNRLNDESTLFVPTATARRVGAATVPVTVEMVEDGTLEERRSQLDAAADLGAGNKLVGVANAQVGRHEDVYLAKIQPMQPGSPLELFVNATVVTPPGTPTYRGYEACFSVPGVSALVQRPVEVIVTNNVPGQEPVQYALRDEPGWTGDIPARVQVHESCHEKGKTFLDDVIPDITAGTPPHVVMLPHQEYQGPRDKPGIFNRYLKDQMSGAWDANGVPSVAWVDVPPVEQLHAINEGHIVPPYDRG